MLREARVNPASAPPFVLYALDLLHVYDVQITMLGTPSWPHTVKKAVKARANALWRAALDSMPRLRAMYPTDAELKVAAYLRIPAFRGRHLLTGTRLGDLQLLTCYASDDTTCLCCLLVADETEMHFLFYCPAYALVRLKHLQALPELDAKYGGTDRERLVSLLHSTQARPNDVEVARFHAVGNYLADLWLERTRLTLGARTRSLRTVRI
jgi:hypothetical protein